jgi:hypothetical protein
MRKQSRTGTLGAAALAAGLLVWSTGALTRAQQQQQEQQQRRSPGERQNAPAQASLELPVRVPALKVSVEAPEEVRVGDSYEYSVTVTNTSAHSGRQSGPAAGR